MTASFPFTFYRYPLSICYPLTVVCYAWLRAKGKCMVNGKGLMVNASEGGFS